LSHSVTFATRTQNDSNTAVNIFVDITRLSSSSTCPIIMEYQTMIPNSLQLITLFQQLRVLSKHRTREINNENIIQFEIQLTNETGESVYIDNDTNNV